MTQPESRTVERHDNLAPEEIAELRDDPAMVHLYDSHRLVRLLLEGAAAKEHGLVIGEGERIAALEDGIMRALMVLAYAGNGEGWTIQHDVVEPLEALLSEKQLRSIGKLFPGDPEYELLPEEFRR